IEVFDKSRYLDKGLTQKLLIEYIALKMPFMMSEFMPVIMLIAVSIYITEISHHHEVVAMRAAGLGIQPILLPIVSVGIVGMFFGLAITEWVTPHTNVRLDYMERTYIQHQPAIKQGTQWLKDDQRFYRLQPLTEKRFKLMMLKVDEQGHWQQRMDANQAYYQDGFWYLKDVYISQPDDKEGMQLTHRDHIRLVAHITPDTAMPPSARHMSLIALYHYAHSLELAGVSNTKFIFAFHHHIASPVSCIIMVLLALALCLNMGSRIAAASWGLMIAITLGLLFYVLSNASGLLANGERLPAAYAAWLPLLFFGGITGFLLLHREG
ncbi:MAG: LptF/LptG family permease, partial [Mariprofundaceae bacterium]|nr:LptF/LptG family permease [Mariprofundaceae bacterium]